MQCGWNVFDCKYICVSNYELTFIVAIAILKYDNYGGIYLSVYLKINDFYLFIPLPNLG